VTGQYLSGENKWASRWANGAIGNTTTASPRPERRLLEPQKVADLLCLSAEDVKQLVATGQITPILIRGQLRFDSLDIDGLIESYKRTAKRHQ
jgi:hypothetical protein